MHRQRPAHLSIYIYIYMTICAYVQMYACVHTYLCTYVYHTIYTCMDPLAVWVFGPFSTAMQLEQAELTDLEGGVPVTVTQTSQSCGRLSHTLGLHIYEWYQKYVKQWPVEATIRGFGPLVYILLH